MINTVQWWYATDNPSTHAWKTAHPPTYSHSFDGYTPKSWPDNSIYVISTVKTHKSSHFILLFNLLQYILDYENCLRAFFIIFIWEPLLTLFFFDVILILLVRLFPPQPTNAYQSPIPFNSIPVCMDSFYFFFFFITANGFSYHPDLKKLNLLQLNWYVHQFLSIFIF